MKKRKIEKIVFAAMMAAFLPFLSCETLEESNKSDAREAAEDFCDCMDYHDEDYCLEELKDNYSKTTYTSSAFIDEFNDTNTCNAVLELITYSKAVSGEGEIGDDVLIRQLE
ncbi:MAG: hypothetical protein LBE91_07560 [Tannerella sp.]|jgi:hypothetical protein|nr:hypothetical protein [Tannerella sp.]